MSLIDKIIQNKRLEGVIELPSISVIIATRNRSSYIKQAIESFINQDYPNNKYEIIIVDNNSTDDTKSCIENYSKNNVHPNIKYFFEPRLGNHYGRNSAAKLAVGDILYFADDDVIADEELLKEIIKPFLLDSRVATATGRVLPKWESAPPEWVKKYCKNRFLSLLDPPESLMISSDINYLYACHQAVRKDVFFESGGFNPESFGMKHLGDGETGLNIKIKKLGYLFGYNGKSVTFHIVPSKRFTQKYMNQRFARNGTSQAYTDFRNSSATVFAIFLILSKKLFIFFPLINFARLLNLLHFRDANISRFFIANGFYTINYVLFCYWLLRESKWRAYTMKSDWLNKDNEFDDVIQEHINK